MFLDYIGLTEFWTKVKTILDHKITGDGFSRMRSLTQEEYESLPESEKNNGTIYITDQGIRSISVSEIDEMFEKEE